MVNLSISKKVSPNHTLFIGKCVDALFDSYIGEYDIFIDSKKFVDSDGVHAGFCFGDDMESVMDFREAKSNFIKTARNGKETVLNWMDELVTIRDLVTKELLPIAYDGLKKMSVHENEIERLLGTIEKRIVSKTGARWQISNYRKLRKTMKQDDALLYLTKTMYENQQTNKPVHEWDL